MRPMNPPRSSFSTSACSPRSVRVALREMPHDCTVPDTGCQSPLTNHGTADGPAAFSATYLLSSPSASPVDSSSAAVSRMSTLLAQTTAFRNGLHGWVRNTPDGCVGRRRGRGGRGGAVRAGAAAWATPSARGAPGGRAHRASREGHRLRRKVTNDRSENADSPRPGLSEGRDLFMTSRRC